MAIQFDNRAQKKKSSRLDPSSPGEKQPTTVSGLLVRILCLGIIAALAVMLTPALISTGQWAFLAVIWGIVAVLVVVYATRRFVPAKYLVPGTLLLVLFVIYPIIVTFQLSSTNYGDGTRTTKEVSVSRIIANSAVQADGARTFNLSVGSEGSSTGGPYTFLLVDESTGDAFAGSPDGLRELDPGSVTVDNDVVTAADGYTILSRVEVNELSQGEGPLVGFAVPTDNGVITQQGFRAVELSSPLVYDEATDTITNTQTGVDYSPVQVGDRKYFTSADGERLSDISWGENVGFGNYIRAFTDPAISGDFLGIFAWTLIFAVLSVATTFALGLFLATVLNDDRVKGQRAFRSTLLLPYAIPAFISLLVWSSFFNPEFGLINSTTGLGIDWLGDPFWAKVAVLLANLWLGFPYMFLVCTGALQAIPSDLKEAASIDGATGLTNFRKITFPLLLVAVAPLLVSSFAFNFNNFGAIFLLTEGGPFSPDNPTAGGTDILISYTYRLAFGGGAQQIGFASAISVMLFILTGILAAIQFRATKKLEEY
ncbi:ABC transporter permease subunit [Microbacterium sp. VKM Ac-2923]|uniref:ABC transporter permease subunit n=1 Tax=Microbacterium sp. VKM Ac-2923 TaxID=2929476 RepID=UPI001FB388CF|nr:ABC transporter permease subunit [Microbacterium sp. VKM Ac-2923]MCJ1707561.1 ABC transporter permease subunit [Microbacterium sp. VKM Ac-2923]